ncbi:hypothetical protein RhiirA5_403595 [Rhizophagus irregularis]|uniref:Uncharacterized protein n=1 Tax=Rhizophagus irregularis TaxID=588596 RepID=A0A2N0NY79_9GLOM|nr:hypothetical protein RhiirA5_403595 [Rhizophagus irregularis]
MASFECKDTNEENRSHVEGALKCHFEKIKISGGGHVSVEERYSNIISHFSIKLLGDVVPNNKELLQSFDEARKLVAELPLYTKQYNDGKGVPIEYTLYPLSELAKLFIQDVAIDNMITELSEETILRVEQVFDEIERLIQKSIILIKEKQEEINNSSKTIEELEGKLYDIMELQISEIKSDQENKRAVIEVHQKRVDQLQKEWEKIKEISLKFTQFSRQNAIAAYNDAYVDYLDLCIKEEKIKRNANSSHYDERILRGLEATRENYLKQVEVIKQEIENNNSSITLKEIAKLEQQLYDLPINGPNLKKLKYEAERSETDARQIFIYFKDMFQPFSQENSFKLVHKLDVESEVGVGTRFRIWLDLIKLMKKLEKILKMMI